MDRASSSASHPVRRFVAVSVVLIAVGCASRRGASVSESPDSRISDAQRTLAMVSIHAHAYDPDADFSGTSLLSLDEAVELVARDVGSGADSRARRAAAELWIHKYGERRSEFRDAIEQLLQREKSLDVRRIDDALREALDRLVPSGGFPPPVSEAALVERLVSNLLVALTKDCPYRVPPPEPGSGVGTDPALVSWSYDMLIPRSLADVARTLDPQSWNAASTLFYDSYLVDTPTSCCPHTPSSDCTHGSTPAGDPTPGTPQPTGKPYGYCGFFEYFCAGPSCPNCVGASCLAAFKNLLCVRTQYEGAWVPLSCFANLATKYSVSYHLAEFISGDVHGTHTGPIRQDDGTLSVRHATPAEVTGLPGNVWSMMHVDKELAFESSGWTAGMSKIMQYFEKELHDQIVEQACSDVPPACWIL